MAELRLGIDTGIDFTGTPGALPTLGPWPRLGGALYAAYMFGQNYAQFSRIPGGDAHGAALDWSGNGRHVATFGDIGDLIGNFGLTAAVTGSEPETPFTMADLWAANSAFSLVALAYTVGTARAVALTRSNNASDPYAGLTLAPQSADARAQATGGGSLQSAQIGTLTDELSAIALYGGTYTTSERIAYSKTGTEATKTANNTEPVTSLNASQPFEFADEAGSGSGNTVLYGLAYYSRVITEEEFDGILLRQRAFHDAIASGLPV